MSKLREEFEQWGLANIYIDGWSPHTVFQRAWENESDYFDNITQRAWEIWCAAWCKKTQHDIETNKFNLLREQAGRDMEGRRVAEEKVKALETELADYKAELRSTRCYLAVAENRLQRLPDNANIDPVYFQRWESAGHRTLGLEEGMSLKDRASGKGPSYFDRYLAKLRADTKERATSKVTSAK